MHRDGMGPVGHTMPCVLPCRAQTSARTWLPCARTTGRAAKSFICHFSHHRDSAAFKRDFPGRKQLPIQLNNAPRDSLKIKSRSEEPGSHRHQALLQHGCAQPRFVYVVMYVTQPSQYDTRQGGVVCSISQLLKRLHDGTPAPRARCRPSSAAGNLKAFLLRCPRPLGMVTDKVEGR